MNKSEIINRLEDYFSFKKKKVKDKKMKAFKDYSLNKELRELRDKPNISNKSRNIFVQPENIF